MDLYNMASLPSLPDGRSRFELPYEGRSRLTLDDGRSRLFDDGRARLGLPEDTVGRRVTALDDGRRVAEMEPEGRGSLYDVFGRARAVFEGGRSRIELAPAAMALPAVLLLSVGLYAATYGQA